MSNGEFYQTLSLKESAERFKSDKYSACAQLLDEWL